jgi:hypothetical protein
MLSNPWTAPYREIGNSIAFLSDLSDVLEVTDQFNFLLIAPFLGCAPAGTAGEGNPAGEAAAASVSTSSRHFYSH